MGKPLHSLWEACRPARPQEGFARINRRSPADDPVPGPTRFAGSRGRVQHASFTSPLREASLLYAANRARDPLIAWNPDIGDLGPGA